MLPMMGAAHGLLLWIGFTVSEWKAEWGIAVVPAAISSGLLVALLFGAGYYLAGCLVVWCGRHITGGS